MYFLCFLEGPEVQEETIDQSGHGMRIGVVSMA